MRILHVTLANPDRHRGGLNNYCRELIAAQSLAGHEVLLLYPGEYTITGKMKIVLDGDSCYRIKNALPVPITFGIDEPKRYMPKSDSVQSVYERWLSFVAPEVIHIHSFMGIHKEFFAAAKEKNIPTIFTTHDYYPLCYKCNLIDSQGNTCNGRSDKNCAKCNMGCGLTAHKQMIMSSRLYEGLKNSKLLSGIKESAHKAVVNKAKTDAGQKEHSFSKETQDCSDKVSDYEELGAYYDEIMQLITAIHCNSPITKEYYKGYFPEKTYKIIPITHSGLTRKFHDKSVAKTVHFAYLGGDSVYKGYYTLLEALKILDKMGIQNWSIDMYGGQYGFIQQDDRISYKGFYSENEIDEIYCEIDVLVVPSQCPETFGFVVLEALSNGVPVICSDIVGSNSLVQAIDERLIVKHGSAADLANKMKMVMDLKPTEYQNLCKAIYHMKLPIDMAQHQLKIEKMYLECM